MTPRKGAGFLRSLLGQEEDSGAQMDEGEGPVVAPPGPPPPTAGHGERPAVKTQVQIAVGGAEAADEISVSRSAPVPAEIRLDEPAPERVAQAVPEASNAPLLATLKSPNVTKRRNALRVLAEKRLSDEDLVQVSSALQDPVHDVRSLALRVLEGEPGCVPDHALSSAALDPDAGIRSRALALLGRTGRPEAVSAIADRVVAEEDEAVIGAGLGAIARLLESADGVPWDVRAVECVARAAGTLSPVVRSRFGRELGLIARLVSGLGLVEGLSSMDVIVRRGAAMLSSEKGSDDVIRALAGCTTDHDADIRTLAEAAAAKVPEGDAATTASADRSSSGLNGFDEELEQMTIPTLIAALHDPHHEVRQRAEDALRSVRRVRLANWILPRIEQSGPEEAARLAEVAVRLNVEDALPALATRVLDLEDGPAREGLSSTLRGFAALNDVISSWLRDPERERRIAALRLAAIIDRTDIGPIEAAMQDPSAVVRLAAIQVVQPVTDEAIADVLINAFASDSSAAVRLAAVQSFVEVDRPLRVRAAEAALRDSDKEVRRMALELLSGASDGETFLLVRALSDPDYDVASHAASVLSRNPGPEALATLWSALRTAPPEVRQLIIDALIGFGPEVLGRLARQAFENPDAQERANGLAMLMRLDDGGTRELLKEALNDPATEVRADALRAMSLRSEGLDVDAIGARVRDPQAEVRMLAVRSLASIDDDRALAYLLDASHDPVEEVRAEARGTILNRRSPAVARLLIRGLRVTKLRRTAAELLAQMGSTASRELLAALTQADPEMTRMIGETLVAAGATEEVIEGLRDRHAEKRRRAIAAIRAMGTTEAVVPLIARLQDPDGRVRALAAETLGELGDARAIEPLKEIFVADPDMDVVAAAERALRKLTGPPPARDREVGKDMGSLK